MATKKVTKKVLSNGLTVLVRPISVVPKVSVQLWYNVGSKDETTGEKGIAHLIEHMIFKGTKKLSECDISLITHKLSGYTNAFTSYDYTGYLFDFPSQQWEASLGILADCMRNATFKEGHLHSELKAVIQELKMYRDSYTSSLAESMIGAIFSDHPYHHPIIGYKQDLWSLKRDSLVNFYQKHYIPNNATLIIVGDVDVDKAFELAQKEFGHLTPRLDYKKEEFYHGSDLQTKSVTLYRDVAVPSYILAWEIPGARAKKAYITDIVMWLLGSGKGSRLYKKLINELKYITDLDAFTYDLFDAGLLFIYFQPKEHVPVEKIVAAIHKELKDIAHAGVTQQELLRASKQVDVEYVGLLEDYQKQAYTIGKFYLATGDEEYAYTVTDSPKDDLAEQVKDFVGSYLRVPLTHSGSVELLVDEEKGNWIKLQELSDQEDARILQGKMREEGVEEGCFVKEVAVYPPKPFKFPRANIFYEENGLKVLYHSSSHIPKIDIMIDLVVDHTYDPVGKEGLSACVAALLLEGTKNFPGEAFADALESVGMSIESSPGSIRLSLLSEDLPKALEYLHEMLVHATMDEHSLEKIRGQMIASVKEFWDSPEQFAGQLVRQDIYKNHPYSKNPLGTLKGIHAITREDVLSFYKKYYNPQGARLGIIGDCERYSIKELVGSLLHSWRGEPIEPVVFPSIEPVTWHELNHPILRDQTVLYYGALSVNRLDKDYDKLLLFDQIFTGGVLSSMASRLFDLREESGLFYTIGGSLLRGVDKDKGLIIIRTIVSNDRLKEAEVAIERVINTAIDTVSDDEFEEAQQAIINSFVTSFASNYATAGTLIALDRFGFPADYFDTRAESLARITKKEMQEVVKKYLTTQRFVLVRAGRDTSRS